MDQIITKIQQYLALVYWCREAILELRQVADTPFTTQLYALIYNLLLIDRAALINNTCMYEKVSQLVEFLSADINDSEPSEFNLETRELDAGSIANLSNDELLLHIGMHYPKKMKHCLKCRACKKINKSRGKKHENCRKSKYVCEGCSEFFNQKVHLCVECFKKFHCKIAYFMFDKGRSANRSNLAGRPRKISRKPTFDSDAEVKIQPPSDRKEQD